MTASLKSPRTVANSARRRCCGGGVDSAVGPLAIPGVAERVEGSEETDSGREVGPGEGDGEPKRRRVDENKRDGSRRVDENWENEQVYASSILQTHVFIPFYYTLFHPRNETHYQEFSSESCSALNVLVTHPQCIHKVHGNLRLKSGSCRGRGRQYGLLKLARRVL